MTPADRLAIGLACAFALFALGWVCRGAFDPVVRDVHHEFAVPVGVDTTLYVYEFSGDCTVRRRK